MAVLMCNAQFVLKCISKYTYQEGQPNQRGLLSCNAPWAKIQMLLRDG